MIIVIIKSAEKCRYF